MWLRGDPTVNVAKLGPDPGLRLPFSKDRRTLLIRDPTGCAGLIRKILLRPKNEAMPTVTLVGAELSDGAASTDSESSWAVIPVFQSGPAVGFELFAVF